MTIQINEAIKEAIQDNLSGQVAGELSNVISDWEEQIKVIPVYKSRIADLESANKILATKLEHLSSANKVLKDQADDITKREKLAEIAERNIELTILKAELEGVKASRQEINQLVDRVFGVPTVTVTNNKTATKNVIVPTDGYSKTLTDSEYEDTKTTERKE